MVRKDMTVQEILMRMLSFVRQSIPAAMIVVDVTMVMLVVAVIQTRGLWVNQKRFKWLGLLFCLKGRECVRLACAWIKFVIVLAFLALFENMNAAAYLMVAVPGLIYALEFAKPRRIPARLMWLLLELLGLMSTNLICGFYRDTGASLGFIIIYIVMAVFMALFACYLFLTELQEISQGRSADIATE